MVKQAQEVGDQVSSLEHWESVEEDRWYNGLEEKERAGDGASELGQDGLAERVREPLCEERDG